MQQASGITSLRRHHLSRVACCWLVCVCAASPPVAQLTKVLLETGQKCDSLKTPDGTVFVKLVDVTVLCFGGQEPGGLAAI